MSELIEIFKDWPVIIQGALGSALFWLFLAIAPKCLFYVIGKFSNKSLKMRKKKLKMDLIKYEAINSNDYTHQTYALSGLTYACLRELIPAFLWLTLGLISMSFIPILGVVGFTGALYYFILAQRITSTIDTKLDAPEVIESINEELVSIAKKLNKPIKQD